MRPELLELIKAFVRDGKLMSPLLDVGGAGMIYQNEQGYNFPKLFGEAGIHYDMVDIEPFPGVDYVGDFSKMKIEPKKNSILCTNMLEHAENPFAIIDNCWKHLACGGTILVSVPDVYGIHNDKDYWRFTELGLDKIMSRFECLEKGHFGSRETGDLEHYFFGKRPYVTQFNKQQREFFESEKRRHIANAKN